MVTPVNVSYSAASGENVYGGKTVIQTPSWRKAMTAGTWVEIPGNTLSDVDPKLDVLINPNYPSSAPWSGTNGFRSIVTAWCGACYDEVGDTLWLPLGGGHGDYAGNEPYKIDLNAEVPAWEMLRNPSGAIGNLITLNDGQEATGLYADGRPRAIHNYNKAVYIPGVGPAIASQGNTSYSAAAGTRKPIFIDPSSGEMSLFGSEGADHGASSSGGGCYDSLRHAIWYKGATTGYFSSYDIATDTWTRRGVSHGATAVSLTYLPDHDCILWTDGALTNGFAVFDCSTEILYEPALSGSLVGSALSGKIQPRVYAPNSVALWDNSSDFAVINTLSFASDPRVDTWSIAQLAVDGANTVIPSTKASNGTFGRFFYSPVLDGFGVINSVYEPIYFYARS